MLRSCYTADMQFFFDSDAIREVDWYFVADDAKCLPFETVFASRIYEREDEPQLPIGELYAPVPWRGGQAPGPVPLCGDCGSAAAWLEGVSISDPDPEVWPGTDVLKCCCPPPPQPIGGCAVGGYWIGPSPPPAIGGLAVGGSFNVVSVEATNGGLALGGETTAVVVTSPTAGLGVGGYSSWVSQGGPALGGEISATYPATADGGTALGGSFVTVFTPATTVTVPFCSNPISKHLRIAVSNAACTCMPTQLDFVYDEVSKWAWSSGSDSCGGTDTSTWYIQVNGGGTGFELVTDVETLVIAGTCGPPYSGSVSHFDGPGHTYCGGFGGWSGVVSEV